MKDAGAVVIGRNEGSRLRASLLSVRRQLDAIVYVDSGSRDDSVAIARELADWVVELDPATPFTAARARNAGAERLLEARPALRFIQFLDGDCLLAIGWKDAALAALEADAGLALACGRRYEQWPDHSRYNRLCDLEWDTPVGEATSCGGDVMMRVKAFRAAGGFDPALIAGEEPDLCHRLRRAGWRLLRLAHAMSYHDAAILRFGQWWRRDRRSGFATAEALARRGREERGLRRRVVGTMLWASPLGWPLWPLLWFRMWRQRGALYATFITLGKLPHAAGQIEYWSSGRARPATLIEYK